MNIYPYVYKITNLLTGQFYIGSRFANVKMNRRAGDDLKHYYRSSSTQVKQEIKTSGIENFQFEVLFQYDSYTACFVYENLLIKNNADNPNLINKWYLDPDKDSKVFYKDTDATRLKKSQSKKGKQSNAHGYIQSAEDLAKANLSRARRRELMTEEEKQKIRESISAGNKGKLKDYATCCAKKFICRLSDRKEFSKASAGKYLKELKQFF